MYNYFYKYVKKKLRHIFKRYSQSHGVFKINASEISGRESNPESADKISKLYIEFFAIMDVIILNNQCCQGILTGTHSQNVLSEYVPQNKWNMCFYGCCRQYVRG